MARDNPLTLSYRQLKKVLNELPEDRLDDQISVYDPADDECFEVLNTYRNTKDHPRTGDILDEGHLVLTLQK